MTKDNRCGRGRLNDFIAEICSPQSFRSDSFRMLSRALMEYWATEKDHEIKNQLLNDLLFKYASSIKKLTELNQLKNKFLGIAAHDLRNPLISLRGLSEIILTEATGPLTLVQREYLSIINKISNDMLSLVNELLDISIIESGKLELQLLRGSLKDLIMERIQVHRVVAEEKQIALHGSFHELPHLPFDSQKIGQVIDNLLSNAIKFSPHGANVYVSLESENGSAKVRVRDEGPGISEEDQFRVFGEFQKLKTEPTGGEKGAGLGLAIAKRIVDAHRGTLKIERGRRPGCTFSFTLPMEQDGEDE